MDNLRKTFGKLTIPLLVLLAISFSALPAHAKYGGGSGTAEEPYLIYDANQMNAIGADSNDRDKHFKLMADIDLGAFTGTSFNIIGNDSNAFTGVFDGNDHTISNFTYDSNDRNYIGLFGYVTGKVQNLTLVDPRIQCLNGSDYFKGGLLVGILLWGRVTNCHIIGGYIEKDFPVWPDVDYNSKIGGLVGRVWENAVVSDCSVENTTVRGDGAGGVAGENYGTVRDCTVNNVNIAGNFYAAGIIGGNLGTVERCAASGVLKAHVYGGGIVGGVYSWPDSSFNAVVRECYAACSVWAGDNAGGLAGSAFNKCLVINCYATGSVDGSAHTAGLVSCLWNFSGTIPQVISCYAAASVVGHKRGGLVNHTHLDGGDVMVVNSFWDVEASGVTDSAGGTGKTTAQMQMARTFTSAGWDFVGETANGTEDIWTIREGVDYPKLAWQLVTGDFDGDGKVDFTDFAILGAQWRQPPGEPSADIVPDGGDGIVNWLDLAALADNWLAGAPPGQAINPNPADGATNVDINADLSWTASVDATSHDVYFGTTDPPPFIRNRTAKTFDPGTMTICTTYYWRVDEVNPWGTTTGIVWSFTTELGPPPP